MQRKEGEGTDGPQRLPQENADENQPSPSSCEMQEEQFLFSCKAPGKCIQSWG